MSTSAPPRDPLAPIDGVVTAMLWCVLAGTALVVVLGVVGAVRHGDAGVSIATIGDREACATVAPGVVPYGESDAGGSGDGVRGMRGGTSQNVRQVELCLFHPTTVQKAASAVGPVGGLVFGVGSLLLIRRLIGTARRDGLFTDAVAGRTRQLGWFLLAMAVVYPFLAAAGQGVVLSAAVAHVSWTVMLGRPDIHLVTLVVALGVISFARILRWAVPLQEEVDATV